MIVVLIDRSMEALEMKTFKVLGSDNSIRIHNYSRERNTILNYNWLICYCLRFTALRFCMCHGLYHSSLLSPFSWILTEYILYTFNARASYDALKWILTERVTRRRPLRHELTNKSISFFITFAITFVSLINSVTWRMTQRMMRLVEIHSYIRHTSLYTLRDWLVPSYIKNTNSTFPHH